MSLPSITDPSESVKKLQCASSRPSRAPDRWPPASRNSRNASHWCPASCPITLSVEFSPRNTSCGSAGYLATLSIMTIDRSRPALPKVRELS